MSRDRVARELAALDVVLKSTEHYVAVVESCALPAGDGSLATWLVQVSAALRRLIDGEM